MKRRRSLQRTKTHFDRNFLDLAEQLSLTDASSTDEKTSGSTDTQETSLCLSIGTCKPTPKKRRKRIPCWKQNQHCETPAPYDKTNFHETEIKDPSFLTGADVNIVVRPLSTPPPQSSSDFSAAAIYAHGDDTVSKNACPTGEHVTSQNTSFEYASQSCSHLASEKFTETCEHSKTIESRRLCEVMTIIEKGRLPRRYAERLLRSDVVHSRYSYKTLKRHMDHRSGVMAHEKLMCKYEHAAVGPSSNNVCVVPSCKEKPSRSHIFYYRLVSEQITALCREKKSLEELLEGCRRAKHALMEDATEILYDFYDGELFRRLHGNNMKSWDEDDSLHVFLNMSTDGFEVSKGRRKPRTAWPLLFTILNFNIEHRFRASNAILSAFIPGTHASEYFDTFIEEVVKDLRGLEAGVRVLCADGKERTLKVFVLFCTGDWPASSKMLGFVGHNALMLCRRCYKSAEYVPECNGVYVLPTGDAQLRNSVVRRNEKSIKTWFVLECSSKRNDSETRQTWLKIENIQKNKSRGWKEELRKVIKHTGVKRRPVVSMLSIDMVESVPYDPMHLVLSGWVNHLIRMSLRKHSKCNENNTFQFVSAHVQATMNKHLMAGSEGIPQTWGRAPESLEYSCNYKAEDLKSFALYYAPILFSRQGIDRDLTEIWLTTSEIVATVFDPTPMQSDCDRLVRLTALAHALLSKLFYSEKSSSFCFSPNTHALLHLGEMMRECGPLINVAQFTVESFIGEVGPLARSTIKPETNMFNETNTLFSLRLLNGGLSIRRDGEEGMNDSSVGIERRQQASFFSGRSCQFLGSSTFIETSRKRTSAEVCAETLLTGYGNIIGVTSIKAHEKCRIGDEGSEFIVETEKSFGSRLRSIACARQKCYIAAHFEKQHVQGNGSDTDFESVGMSEVESSGGHKQERLKKPKNIDVFYGVINGIWEVLIRYQDLETDIDTDTTVAMVEVDWIYGLRRDKKTGNVSTKLGQRKRKLTRSTVRTVECIASIDRVIGYFDFEDRRYFLDPQKRNMEGDRKFSLHGFGNGSK